MLVHFAGQVYVLDGCSASDAAERGRWGGHAGSRADFDVEVVEAVLEWLVEVGVNREDDPLVGEVHVYVLASSVIVSSADVVSSVGDDIVLDGCCERGPVDKDHTYLIPCGGGTPESDQVAGPIFVERVNVMIAVRCANIAEAGWILFVFPD